MTIAQDVQKRELNPRIKLFEIDLTGTKYPALAGNVLRYTPMTDNYAPVMFGDEDYYPFPIEIYEIDFTSDDAPGRPRLEVSNINKIIGSMSFIYGDLVGATVTFIETFSNYLNLSTRFSLPPLEYTISKKLLHNRLKLAFELRSPIDKERAYLPKRQMLKKDFPGLGINKNVK